MFIWPDKWCVYGHSVDGEIVYIGSGKAHRALDFRSRHGRKDQYQQPRSREWFAATKNGFNLLLISWHDTISEVRAEERRLISLIKPKCNVRHTGRKIPNPAASEQLKGNTHLLGHRHSDESKKKMADAQRRAWHTNPHRKHRLKPVFCVETGESYSSMLAACKAMGRSQSRMSTAIKRGLKVNGLTFQMLEG